MPETNHNNIVLESFSSSFISTTYWDNFWFQPHLQKTPQNIRNTVCFIVQTQGGEMIKS